MDQSFNTWILTSIFIRDLAHCLRGLCYGLFIIILSILILAHGLKRLYHGLFFSLKIACVTPLTYLLRVPSSWRNLMDWRLDVLVWPCTILLFLLDGLLGFG